MRWKRKFEQYWIGWRFLFLPKCHDGEVRWLEWAKLHYAREYSSMDGHYWVLIGFINP